MGVPPNHPSHDHFSLETCNLGYPYFRKPPYRYIPADIPSGKLTKNYGKSHFSMGKLHYILRPFSVAILT